MRDAATERAGLKSSLRAFDVRVPVLHSPFHHPGLLPRCYQDRINQPHLSLLRQLMGLDAGDETFIQQRPITFTVLTLLVIPALYSWARFLRRVNR